MNAIAYFLRKNNWILWIFVFLLAVVSAVAFWGFVLLWLTGDAIPIKWLVAFGISFVAIIICLTSANNYSYQNAKEKNGGVCPDCDGTRRSKFVGEWVHSGYSGIPDWEGAECQSCASPKEINEE